MAYGQLLAHSGNNQDIYVCTQTFTATSETRATEISDGLNEWMANNPPADGSYDTENCASVVWQVAGNLWIIVYILLLYIP